MSKGFGQAGFQVIDVKIVERTVTIGATAIALFRRNPNRLMVDLIAGEDNIDNIYIDDTSGLTTTTYEDVIPIGMPVRFSRHDKREKWAISGTAAQNLTIREYIYQAGVPAWPRT